MLTAVALTAAVFLCLGLVAQLVSKAAPGSGPLRDRLDVQYAVIGLGLVGVAVGGVVLLRAAQASPSFQTENRVLGAAMLVVGLGGATACLGALLVRRRR